jgi:hypothetical protein
MSLYTLNGALLVEQTACESPDESILACMFYEGVSNEWLERELLFTGHRRGVVNVSSYAGFLSEYVLTLGRCGARPSATDDSSWS